MSKIAQGSLFCWKEIEELDDLGRLRLVLEYVPDEVLMEALEDERGKGRNDYPIRAMWNMTLAGVVYEHVSVASLLREMHRNSSLRRVCGFGLGKIPTVWSYTRFLKNLMKHADLLEDMFDRLVESLREELAGFGEHLSLDSKAIRSHGKKPKEDEDIDGRRDTDANFGKKTYRGVREDGSLWEKVKSWFGYKLHMVVDSDYELPVAFSVTKASTSDIKAGKVLIEELSERHEELVNDCETMAADKGYDDGEFIKELWEMHNIKPVISIRDLWKDGEATRLVNGHENVVHNYRGDVFCFCPETGEMRRMAYGGFEADRGTLKYRCPASHYDFECKGKNECPVGCAVRIKLDEDRRIFTPLARSSYAWKKEYRKRTSVERVNSRLDVSFGFERHFIRGLEKMKVRCGIALIVMLAMALGRIREKQRDKMRSLVRAA